MSKIDDDSVEDFFKNADDSRFETEYNENDWNKMAQRLDEEEERLALLRRNSGRYIVAAGVLLLLLATSVSVYLYNSNNASKEVGPAINTSERTDTPSVDENTLQQIDSAQEMVAENQASDQNIESTASVENTSEGEEVESGSAPENRIDSKEKNNRDKILSQQATTDRSSDVRANEEASKNHIGDVEENHRSVNHESNLSDNEIKDETLIVAGTAALDEVDGATDTSILTDETVSENVKLSDSLDMVKPDTIKSVEELKANEEPEERKDENLPSPGRWMISVSLAPDFSKTPNSTFDVPVGSFGVSVSYQFARRWNISTGVARVDKKYWGYGDEYYPPYGYWNYVTNGEVPETVEGNCLVWEIPLSLAYNVVETKRSRLFVSAGVSSYLMRSEKYKYTFEDPNPGAAEGWSTDEPSSYWFDIGSLSVGYDFRVSPTVSLSVEPYYKIPFCGMGWADIDMYSTGVLFSARYRFLKQEK